MAALLPGVGGILLAGAFVLDRQRRRRQQALSIASSGVIRKRPASAREG